LTPAVPVNIWHEWKWVAIANTLAYYNIAAYTATKNLLHRPLGESPGAFTIKHNGLVIYGKLTDFVIS
jgi:hypothetical protein